MGFFIIDKIKKMMLSKYAIEKDNSYFEVINGLKDGVFVTEIENGIHIIDNIFMQVFGSLPPTHGNHVVTFCKMQDGSYRFANYLNYWIKDKCCYVGGAITDKDLMKTKVSSELRESINSHGGLAKIALMYVMDRTANNVDAVFVHSSVPRALEIILNFGFISTSEDFLYVKWSPGVTESIKKKLLLKAIKVGSF